MFRLCLTVVMLMGVAMLTSSPAVGKTKEQKDAAKAAKAERREQEREKKAAKETEADARRARARAEKQAATTQKAEKAAAEAAHRRARKEDRNAGKSGSNGKRVAATQPVAPKLTSRDMATPRSARQASEASAPAAGTVIPRRQGSVFQNTLEQQRQAAERAKAQAAASGEFESSNEYKPE